MSIPVDLVIAITSKTNTLPEIIKINDTIYKVQEL
jgi:hypothetical protein